MHQASQANETAVASARNRSALSRNTTASTASHGPKPLTVALPALAGRTRRGR